VHKSSQLARVTVLPERVLKTSCNVRGGSTEFVTPESGMLIEIEGLEQTSERGPDSRLRYARCTYLFAHFEFTYIAFPIPLVSLFSQNTTANLFIVK